MGQIRNVYKIWLEILKGRKRLGRSRHRWEDNIKVNFWEQIWRVWTVCIWLRTGAAGGLF
jgi:endo-alpha-1,4-polygalactosaminidase (GH114 family)